jgi:hypothetical protein
VTSQVVPPRSTPWVTSSAVEWKPNVVVVMGASPNADRGMVHLGRRLLESAQSRVRSDWCEFGECRF